MTSAERNTLAPIVRSRQAGVMREMAVLLQRQAGRLVGSSTMCRELNDVGITRKQVSRAARAAWAQLGAAPLCRLPAHPSPLRPLACCCASWPVRRTRGRRRPLPPACMEVSWRWGRSCGWTSGAERVRPPRLHLLLYACQQVHQRAYILQRGTLWVLPILPLALPLPARDSKLRPALPSPPCQDNTADERECGWAYMGGRMASSMPLTRRYKITSIGILKGSALATPHYNRAGNAGGASTWPALPSW